MRRPVFDPWVGKICWTREWQPSLVFFLGDSVERGTWRATVHRILQHSYVFSVAFIMIAIVHLNDYLIDAYITYQSWPSEGRDHKEICSPFDPKYLAKCLVCACVCVCVCERERERELTTQLGLTLCSPIDCSLPGSSVQGIFQVVIWSGLPLFSPGDLSHPGIEPESLWQAVLYQLSHQGRPLTNSCCVNAYVSIWNKSFQAQSSPFAI